MYNYTKYGSRVDAFFRDLFGLEALVDVQAAAANASARGYVPPASLKILPCHEDANGEWVPELQRAGSQDNNLKAKVAPAL